MSPCRQDDAFLAQDVPKDGSLCGPPATTSNFPHGFGTIFVSPSERPGLAVQGSSS